MRLLIAEDDPKLLRSLKHIFEGDRYTVDGVESGIDALAYAETKEYDGMVLDIMLPGLDGVTVLRRARAAGTYAPALFLTARSEVCQRVEGLDAGADDYLAKPFSTEELLARVRAMLRRRENFTPDLLRAWGLELNRSTYELGFQGRAKALSGKEFQIMEMLMERPNFIVTTDACMARAWGWDREVDVGAVWVHVSHIRKKLAQLEAPVAIRFVRGAGYVLEAAK